MIINHKFNKRIEKFIGVILIFITLSPLSSLAQDPHFSQYFTSPMSNNPATIGKGVDHGRVIANIRSQWWGTTGIQPYNTETVSYEQRLAKEKLNDNNNLSFGLMLLTDQSNGGLLQNNFFSGGFSYTQALDGQGNQLLSAGFSATYANRILNSSMFEFQSQFGSMGFQRAAPSSDPVSLQSNKYWDINAGVHYSARINDGFGFNLGAGMFHLNRPTEGVYTNNQYQIDTRLNLQGGLQFYFNDKTELHISGNYESQYNNSIFTVGTVCKIKIEDENLQSVNIGVFDRFTDAVYPYFGLETKDWLIAVSYDVVTSSIKTVYNSVSSMEFSIGWKIPGRKSSKATTSKGVVNY